MSSSFTRLYVHLVWTTWNRERHLDARMVRRLGGRLASICHSLQCPAIAIGGVEDHVHLLVSLHPSTSVADLVRALKVGTSVFVRRESQHPDFAWQGGYGAFSVRESELETVSRYIQNQAIHHAAATTLLEFEQVSCNPAKAG